MEVYSFYIICEMACCHLKVDYDKLKMNIVNLRITIFKITQRNTANKATEEIK